MKIRLQKFIAETGAASRRAAESFIVQGKVAVNGRIVTELGSKVDSIADKVQLNGVLLKPKRKLYVAVNKPPGYVCSRQDEEGRKLIAELLPKEWGNLYTVGRLDRESEGLIFMTNDGDFCLKLTHPRYGVRKIYVVGIAGLAEETLCKQLEAGLEDEGEFLHVERATILGASKAHSVVEVELAEGKNREVRRLFEAFNFKVERLQRIQIGPIRLGDLKQGRWRTLNEVEIRTLASGKVQPKQAAKPRPIEDRPELAENQPPLKPVLPPQRVVVPNRTSQFSKGEATKRPFKVGLSRATQNFASKAKPRVPFGKSKFEADVPSKPYGAKDSRIRPPRGK